MSAAPPAAQFGDFVVQRMIGQGSFGKVMLAKNQRTEETVSLFFLFLVFLVFFGSLLVAWLAARWCAARARVV